MRKKGAQITVWHGLDPEVLEQAEKIDGYVKLGEYSFHNHREEYFAQVLRESVGYARLVLNATLKNNPTILDNWLPKKNFKGKVLNFFAQVLGSTLKSFKEIEAIESLIKSRYRKSEAYRKYKEELELINPDILVCTHQRMPNAGIAMLAAADMGIQTVAMIFSWDNLPKGRLPVRGSYFLVWSDYMKSEMEEYFPDIPQDKVIVVGTPQFDFYKNNSILVEKSIFAQENGLDHSKHWICFSGDDSLTSPHDPLYLRDIAEQLKDRSDIQILFRPVPVEGHERYTEILEKYPQIVLMSPKWKRGKVWNTYFPYFEDIGILVNLAKHCKAVVNVGSTMALDFAQFNNPGLYVNYDVKPDHPWTISRTYKFQHFRSMEGLQPVGWINSPEEIEEKIDLAIFHPESIGPDRLRWKEKIVFDQESELASERIAGWLLSITKSK
ncbi:MAG: hypothetical protein ACK4SF_09735 [Algoriphagus aquaeductus]|uniref:hypothetical protein n=1 Tax=Algoriphagus aquaeductus TaxID=475299 RepID=UPI003918D118